MSKAALAIRDAIYNRVENWPGYAEFKLSPHVTIQPENLPSLAVYLTGETMRPDGDANVLEPHFMSEISVAISVIRKSGDRSVLEGQMDADATAFENAILTDPTFVHFGGDYEIPDGETWTVGDRVYWDFAHTPPRATSDPNGTVVFGFIDSLPAVQIGRVWPLFEAITQITRRPMFPQSGDQYYAEMRLEMTFQTRVDYPPVILDDYLRMRMTTRQLGGDPDTPAIITVIDQAE